MGRSWCSLGQLPSGEGYDFAHTAMVIHWGTRWGISQFLQATGRAARGAGEIGWSYAIIPPLSQPFPAPADLEEQFFHEYLQAQVCRRSLINREFNGRATQGCLAHEKACDLCQVRQEELHMVSARAREALGDGEGLRLKLKAYIKFFEYGICLYCFLMTQINPSQPGMDYHHHHQQCTHAQSLISSFNKHRHQFHFEPHGGCFLCLLPTRACGNSTRDGDQCF
ncbi:hypothetical protein MAP00_004211, partial [Monascus purpureus]